MSVGAEPPDAPPTGDLPRLEELYELREERGQGGFGLVTRGVTRATGEAVAVKVSLLAGSPEDDQRILREVRLLQGVRSPRLVSLLACCRDAHGRLALVYEFLTGQLLSARLSQRRPDDAELVAWCDDLAEALDALHRRGLVHRDLKPSNVMVEPSGRLRLFDFGLLKPERQGATLTADGVVSGTPSYMAPEQFTLQRATKAADLYAFGCVVYEMVAGRPPFTGPVAEVVRCHLTVKPERVRSSALWPVLQRALAKEPTDRFEDAPALASAVTEALAARPADPTRVLARVPRPAAPAGRAWRAAVVVAAVAAVVALLWSPAGSPDDAAAPARPAPAATVGQPPRLLAGPFVYPRSTAADVDVVVDRPLPGAVAVDGGSRSRLLLRGPFPEGAGHRYSVTLEGGEGKARWLSFPGIESTPSVTVAFGDVLVAGRLVADRPAAEDRNLRNVVAALPVELRPRVVGALPAEDRRRLDPVDANDAPAFTQGPLVHQGRLILGDNAGRVMAVPLVGDADFHPRPPPRQPPRVLWQDPASNYGGIDALAVRGERAYAWARRTDAALTLGALDLRFQPSVEADVATLKTTLVAAVEATYAEPRWVNALVDVSAAPPREIPAPLPGGATGAPAAFGSVPTALSLTPEARGLLVLRHLTGADVGRSLLELHNTSRLAAAPALDSPQATWPELLDVRSWPVPLDGQVLLATSALSAPGGGSSPGALRGYALDSPGREAWRFDARASLEEGSFGIDPASGFVATSDGRRLYLVNARARLAAARRGAPWASGPARAEAGELEVDVADLRAAPGQTLRDGLRFVGPPLPMPRGPGSGAAPRRCVAFLGARSGSPHVQEWMDLVDDAAVFRIRMYELDLALRPPTATPLVDPFSLHVRSALYHREARHEADQGCAFFSRGQDFFVLDLDRRGREAVLLHHRAERAWRMLPTDRNVVYFLGEQADLRCVAFSPTRLPARAQP